ncbi:peptidoglycan DD-metalloendopeptidase family protein [Candidatus Saccharibacteria bacterium]|nr:peptidoglycan DD-metalloendopeptidase family protein [Candidatus Saccharibacteria bacterium]
MKSNKILNKILTLFLLIVINIYIFQPSVSALLPLTQRDIDSINKGLDYRDPQDPQTCSSDATISTEGVYFIGDSWLARMESVSPNIQTTFEDSGITVTGSNSSVGRSISGGGQKSQNALEALDADADKIRLAGTVVVVLGTNSDNYDKKIPEFLDKLNSIKTTRVVWVNTSANSTQAIADSAGKANAAIMKYADESRYNYTIADFFSYVYPSDSTPDSISTGVTSPLMDSDKIHPSIPEGTKLLISIIQSAVGRNLSETSTSTASGSALPEIAKQRLSGLEERVTQNKSVYEELSSEFGIPWQVFGALHFREAGADPNRSMLGGEPLGQKAVDTNNTPQTLLESGEAAYKIFEGNAKGVYNVTVSANMSFQDLQYAFLAYHRGYLYKNVPVEEGGPWEPGIAPYVMNLYDENHLGPDGVGMERPVGTSGNKGGVTSSGKHWGETVSGIDNPPGAMTYIAYFGYSPAGSSTCGVGALASGQLLWPVVVDELPYGRITSCWSDLRHKTVSGGSYYHSGIDIAAPTGTKVIAMQNGTVVFAGWHSAYGSLIVIDQGNGIWSHYGHLSAISSGVSEGASVSAGTQIGEVGNTGVSLGPHLHLNMYKSWPFGALPEGAANSNGKETLNPLTNGLQIPQGVTDEAGCSNWPNGGREVNIAL